MREITSIWYFVLAALLCSSCSADNAIQWQEQTKLASGTAIIVDRVETYRHVCGGDGCGGLLQTTQLKATLPPDKKVDWEGAGINPVAIDSTANGDVYLVALVETLVGTKTYPLIGKEKGAGLGEERCVAFRLVAPNHWERIPLETLPPIIQPNLLVDTGTYFLTQKHPTNQVVSLAIKEEVASQPGLQYIVKNWPKN